MPPCLPQKLDAFNSIFLPPPLSLPPQHHPPSRSLLPRQSLEICITPSFTFFSPNPACWNSHFAAPHLFPSAAVALTHSGSDCYLTRFLSLHLKADPSLCLSVKVRNDGALRTAPVLPAARLPSKLNASLSQTGNSDASRSAHAFRPSAVVLSVDTHVFGPIAALALQLTLI